jgi:hypothetical protein
MSIETPDERWDRLVETMGVATARGSYSGFSMADLLRALCDELEPPVADMVRYGVAEVGVERGGGFFMHLTGECFRPRSWRVS